MTQSLLSSWQYIFQAEDDKADAAYQSFLDTLQRKPRESTKAMKGGQDFEETINRLVARRPVEFENGKQKRAAIQIARRCVGGQSQTPLTGIITVHGMEFILYGVCDFVKAGVIIDIKKTSRYEYGKFLSSPQHPMYLHLLPEARRFDYLIFDGQRVYQETYRREDCKPIAQSISEFIHYLDGMNMLNIYEKHWAMTQEREEKRYGIYQREE